MAENHVCPGEGATASEQQRPRAVVRETACSSVRLL